MVRTSYITMPSMVGIVGRAPAEDENVWCFLSVCLFYLSCFGMKFVITQCNFQNNYEVIAQRKVCSCTPIFNFLCGPPIFSHRGKFIPKIAIFRTFWGCRPTFLSQNGEIWYEGADLGLPPQANFFYKNRLRRYTLLGKIYTKNYQFRRFGGCKPTF